MGEFQKTRRAPQSRASVAAKEKARKLRARAMMRQSQSSRPSWLANSLIQAKEKQPVSIQAYGAMRLEPSTESFLTDEFAPPSECVPHPTHILVYQLGQ